jgi:hypothetical protein
MTAWYVGADPASQDAGLAAFSDAGELRHVALKLRGQMPTRLAALRRETRAWLQFVADDGAWCVCVERPSTRHGGATLLASYGVMVEACAALLPCPVLTLVPTQVDDAAQVPAVKGLDRKARIRRRAHELGYDGPSQDVADAVVAAEAARALTLRTTEGAAA